MTQEEMFQKISTLGEEGKLVMSRGKCFIPIPEKLIKDKVIIAKLYINHNINKKLITSQQGKGYKDSLKETNVHNILEKLPTTSDGYCSLDHIDQISESCSSLVTLKTSFESIMKRGFGEDYNYFSFNTKLKAFFKYLPQLSYLFKPYIDNQEFFDNTRGYCCEEHCGPKEKVLETNFLVCISDISAKLVNINETFTRSKSQNRI